MTCDLSETMSVHENEGDIFKPDPFLCFFFCLIATKQFPHVNYSSHMTVTVGKPKSLITKDGVTDQS